MDQALQLTDHDFEQGLAYLLATAQSHRASVASPSDLPERMSKLATAEAASDAAPPPEGEAGASQGDEGASKMWSI